jgi:hypothetical protein
MTLSGRQRHEYCYGYFRWLTLSTAALCYTRGNQSLCSVSVLHYLDRMLSIGMRRHRIFVLQEVKCMATKRIDDSERYFRTWFCLSWNGNGTMLVFSSSHPDLELDELRETRI